MFFCDDSWNPGQASQSSISWGMHIRVPQQSQVHLKATQNSVPSPSFQHQRLHIRPRQRNPYAILREALKACLCFQILILEYLCPAMLCSHPSIATHDMSKRPPDSFTLFPESWGILWALLETLQTALGIIGTLGAAVFLSLGSLGTEISEKI